MKNLNISMFFTLLRLPLLLPAVYFFYIRAEDLFLVTCGVMFLSDLLDGGFAWLLSQENSRRRLLDTIIDKTVFTVLLVVVWQQGRVSDLVFYWILSYFLLLVAGGAFAYYYLKITPLSNNIGRASAMLILGLVVYEYFRLPEFLPTLTSIFYWFVFLVNLIALGFYTSDIYRQYYQERRG